MSHAENLHHLTQDRRRFLLASRLLELGNQAKQIAHEIATLSGTFPEEAGRLAELETRAAALALATQADASALTKKGPTS